MSRSVKITLSLTLEQVALLRSVLKYGWVRDPHPNWAEMAGQDRMRQHHDDVASADVMIGKIDARLGMSE